MITIDPDRCTHELAFDRLVPALARAFEAGCHVPPRHIHPIAATGAATSAAASGAASSAAPGATADATPSTGSDAASGGAKAGGTVLIMPAWTDGEDGLLGIKIVNVFPGNAGRGLPGLHATYTLFDATTGVPLAALDGDVITVRRTAATAALGASRLLPARYLQGEPVDLCIVGSGRVARWLPWAFASVVTLGDVRIWNHRAESAASLARLWREENLPARSISTVDELEAGVRASGLVSCATLATEPLVRREWLQPDSHLDLIGSFAPTMREATTTCFAQADVWVDTDEAATKAGDLLDAFAAGTLSREAIRGDLRTLLARSDAAGTSQHRDGQRTVFKSVGSATADLAAAALIWRAVAG